MKKTFSVIMDLKNRGSLTFHPDCIKEFKGGNLKKGFVRFGLRSYEVKINTSYEVNKSEILLPRGCCDYFKIPLASRYEMVLCGNEIILGPFIGILAARREEELDKIVDNLSNYVYDYKHIGGAVLAFSLEGVHPLKQFIKGYVFNPQTKTWDKGLYMYPAVLFRRVGMKKVWRNHFHSLMGNRIFNDYIFNKWEMHQWLSNFPEVKEYLPESIIYQKRQDLIWFLDQYGTAFIKPIYGSQGTGVIKALKKENRFLFSYSEEGEDKEFYGNGRQAKEFLESAVKRRKFIIQQGISLISYEGKVIDFRLIILKNEYGEWQDLGMIGRYGAPGKVVSNVSRGGRAEPGEVTLKKALKLGDAEVWDLRKRMSDIAINAAEKLEASGIHCANLGVDLGVDVNGRVWIIEINNKDPNHTIAIDAGERAMFYKSKLTTMLYAKKLAGF